MAKFANVTYGTHGDSAEYTYVVNDNVRKGDRIQPSVIHYRSGKVFATTAVIESTNKEGSKGGKEKKENAQAEIDFKNKIKESKGKPVYNREIATAYTGKELGLQGQGYKEQVRMGNVAKRLESLEDNQSGRYKGFDEYSKQFMDKKGE